MLLLLHISILTAFWYQRAASLIVETNPLCNIGDKRGLCMPEDICKKPSSMRFPCPVVYCKQFAGKPRYVCCFDKKNKPPKKECFPPALKPGQCPEANDVGGPCVESCQSDADCLGIRKCCSNGCGHRCHLPITVFCAYRPSSDKEFVGKCLAPKLCKKKKVGCPGIKCKPPYQDSVCCFDKGKQPDKKTCQDGPSTLIKCFIHANNESFQGECKSIKDCKKPNKLRVPCTKFDRCPDNQVCCFTKKTKPPTKYC